MPSEGLRAICELLSTLVLELPVMSACTFAHQISQSFKSSGVAGNGRDFGNSLRAWYRGFERD